MREFRGKRVSRVVIGALLAALSVSTFTSSNPVDASSCGKVHEILRNDSWTRLAARFDVPLGRLLHLNSATTRTPLFIGNRVCIAAAQSIVAAPSSSTTAPMTSTTVSALPIAPTLKVDDMERCQPVTLRWSGASPETGLYSLQWVRVSSSGVADFSRYNMLSVRGNSVTLPYVLNGGATYAMRVFAMRSDWDGYAHTNQNVTPHSDVVTFTVPACAPPTPVVRQWVARGAAQNGLADDDHYGYGLALSSDGSVMAVGAPNRDVNGANSGEVKVFAWSGSAWVQRGSAIEGEAVEDWSGRDISLSSDGTVLAIGASYNDGGGADSGHIRVYAWSGSAWVQRGLDIDGQSSGDRAGLGTALSADGLVLAIGAPLRSAVGTERGNVRVFRWNGSAWVQRGLDIDGQSNSDWFGYDVSLSSDGSVLAVGAPYRDTGGSDRGEVQVYEWNGTAWTQRGTNLNGSSNGDWLGWSVSLSSDGLIVAAGAPKSDGAGADSGMVRVYSWSGSAWVQRGTDIAGEHTDDQAGYGGPALSSDGSIIAVPSLNADNNGVDTGAIRVFEWSGSAWVQRGVTLNGDAASGWFGRSLALSSDGAVLVGFSIANPYAGRILIYAWE